MTPLPTATTPVPTTSPSHSPTPRPTPTPLPSPVPTPAPTRTPTVAVAMVMAGLTCTDFDPDVYELALDSVINNATFFDEVCSDVGTDPDMISVASSVSVPMFVKFKYDDDYSTQVYVTEALNNSVNDGSLTLSIP